MRSACNAIAATKAALGKLCSTQQSRKYASPANSSGGAGPCTTAIRLDKNSSVVPGFSRASRGGRIFREGWNGRAGLALSCR